METIFYNQLNDKIYLVLYKLGSGISSTVWYSIEISNYIKKLKTKENFEINCKALKIFNSDKKKEFKKELTLNELLIYNGIKSDYINYNEGGFINGDYMILVNDVMDVSLNELCEILNFDFNINIKNKIYDQMVQSIHYMHLCNYIHSDIKLENFLVCGLNNKQLNILNYAKKYNYSNFFKNKINKTEKTENILKSTKNHLEDLIVNITTEFELFNKSDSSDSSDSSISNDSCDNESDEDSNNTYDINDYESNSSYSTKASTFMSEMNEFSEKYDKFHICEIEKYINKKNNEESENNSIQTQENEEMILFYRNKLNNIDIKLSDFGLIKKPGSKDTIHPRCFRSPYNILGYVCDFRDDIWALNIIKSELFENKVLHDICHDKNYNIYNNNLLSIKKILNKNTFIDMEIIKSSNRVDSILASDGSFLFK